MARISAAEQSTQPLKQVARLQPPASLTAAEREKWHGVVDTMPPDGLRPEHTQLLVELARTSVACDRLERMVADALEAGDAKAIKLALGLRNRESKHLVVLATKLRIPPQSSVDAVAAGRQRRAALPVAKPWEA